VGVDIANLFVNPLSNLILYGRMFDDFYQFDFLYFNAENVKEMEAKSKKFTHFSTFPTPE
jgi:hypothetical protein